MRINTLNFRFGVISTAQYRKHRAQADLKSGIISDYKSLYYKAVGFLLHAVTQASQRAERQIRLSGSKVLRLGCAKKKQALFLAYLKT